MLQRIVLRRMRNQHMLIRWAMVQAVAFYWWSGGRSALNTSLFLGIVCSSRSCGCNLGIPTKDLSICHTRYLSKNETIVFIMDNYKERHNLIHQCGGHRCTQFPCTHEIASVVNEYTDSLFDAPLFQYLILLIITISHLP